MHRVGVPARAHRASALTGLGAGINVVLLDTVDFDPKGVVDTAHYFGGSSAQLVTNGGVFIVPANGWYDIDYNIRGTPTAAGQTVEARLVKNPAGANTTVSVGSRADTDGATLLCSVGSDKLQFVAGDIIELGVVVTGVTALNIGLPAASNYIAIQQIA